MPVGVVLVVEVEAVLALRVHPLDQVAQLGGEPAGADELEVAPARRSAMSLGAAPADHVDVELGHDRVARHGGMPGEPVGAEQAQLLGGVPDEEHRALGPVGPFASGSAISSTPTVPLPSSSAPLQHRVAPRGRARRRRLSRIASIRAACAAVGSPGVLLAPSGRITRLKARSESWSSVSGRDAVVIVVRADRRPSGR